MGSRADDFQLVQRLIARDRGAWETFVRTYQPHVVARIQRTASECRIPMDTADTDDLVADVFAGLLANDLATLRRFEGRCRLATFLAVIARRACLKVLGRSALRGHHPLDDWSSSKESDALERIILAEESDRLRATLRRLKPRDQEILELYYMEDLGYSEISRRLGISINTVGPKLHRAQSRLKKMLRWV